MTEIRGLTLTHPWPWCIVKAGKDVENRTWHQGGRVGMFLAIHGGVVPGQNTGKREEARLDLAAAFKMVGLTDGITPEALLSYEMGMRVTDEDQFFLPGIVAVAQLAAVTQSSTSKWAARGQFHWLLADVTLLPEPVPHRGAQGLWTIEPAALVVVREGYRQGRS
ncbi:hypothetical protein [Deinococcus alpinitundrae]|uniref:hypothetical protein n=1 Tax=Deinococcus alpinitundrae TaxID=468913 RepID=UPI0013798D42|nr:hypothetical protein [Deinococcus alpinitundrae]